MSNEEELSVEGRKKLEAFLEETKAFLGSKIHRAYLAGTQRQIDEVVSEILDPEVTDTDRLLQLKGHHSALQSSLSIFEDNAANLEERIQAHLDRENETQQNTES